MASETVLELEGLSAGYGRIEALKGIDLKVGRIDPGHAVGPDGKRWLFLSAGYLVGLADDGLSVTGEPKKIYDGWQYPEEWVVEGFAQPVQRRSSGRLERGREARGQQVPAAEGAAHSGQLGRRRAVAGAERRR